jgi:hypothetical protein
VPGAWHHLVYVYDGTNRLSIYVDGALRLGGTYGPMPLGFEPVHPGGMAENSPAGIVAKAP